MGAGGEGRGWPLVAPEKERADVSGVGSSEGVAWGEVRLLFPHCFRSRVVKEWEKERTLGVCSGSDSGHIPFEERGEL